MKKVEKSEMISFFTKKKNYTICCFVTKSVAIYNIFLRFAQFLRRKKAEIVYVVSVYEVNHVLLVNQVKHQVNQVRESEIGESEGIITC